MVRRLTLLEKLKSLTFVTTCSTGFFVGINLYKQNEEFYNDYVMPFIHLFPPEMCHQLAVFALKHNLFPKQKIEDPKSLNTTFLGHQLRNPIGIAAGFDKQAEAINGLTDIGFGFVEIGSVTPLPQPGNPKPRVFRLNEDKAIINRYGFNSDGHDAVFDRIKSIRKNNHSMVGINLGKNKSSENSINDYTVGVTKFSPVADYLVINVSSPNTPGLRSLQNENDLKELLTNVIQIRNSFDKTHQRPILLKLAPDLTNQELREISKVIQRKECRIDGLIISNTTVERDPQLIDSNKIETGGLSGKPLTTRSTEIIGEMYKLTNGKIPIVGVGGIFTGRDAYDKILAGASVVQLYTALIYHGPPIVLKIKRELNDLLAADGFSNVSEAVGKGTANGKKINITF